MGFSRLISSLVMASATAVVVACASAPPEVVNLDEGFDKLAEIDRLRFFRETNSISAQKQAGLTGKGVRVTIMGEQVDATHPDLTNNVKNQYNAFVKKGSVLRGNANMPYGEEHLKPGYGHGTHIAGTIAAACDNVGIQGIACNAEMDVYDLGAYDNFDDFKPEGWGDIPEEARFIQSFATAVRDVTKKGKSKIITGSFNLEAPAIKTIDGGPLQGKPISEIIKIIEKAKINSFSELADKGYVKFQNMSDIAYLKRMEKQVEDSDMLIMSPLLPRSKEWAELIDALAEYQKSGGVYIVTESNQKLDNHTSIFNAMPDLSDKIDEDLWINIVMVEREETGKGNYSTPINTCGELSKNYCIITPSYYVLSTMTERVAEWGGSPLFMVDGRPHQVFGGHSMGAPMVAAALALMQEYNKQHGSKYSMKDLVRFLKKSANKNFPGYDANLHGLGMLDVGAALKMMGANLPNTSAFQKWSCGLEDGSSETLMVEYYNELDQQKLNLVYQNDTIKLSKTKTTKTKVRYENDNVVFYKDSNKAQLIFEPHRTLNCKLK